MESPDRARRNSSVSRTKRVPARDGASGTLAQGTIFRLGSERCPVLASLGVEEGVQRWRLLGTPAWSLPIRQEPPGFPQELLLRCCTVLATNSSSLNEIQRYQLAKEATQLWLSGSEPIIIKLSRLKQKESQPRYLATGSWKLNAKHELQRKNVWPLDQMTEKLDSLPLHGLEARLDTPLENIFGQTHYAWVKNKRLEWNWNLWKQLYHLPIWH